MKRAVIYIAGLGHSGSTLLDLLFSEHARVLSLGEVSFVLSDKARSEEGTKEVCSCGDVMESCVFWGPFLPQLRAQLGKPYSERYRLLLQHVDGQYGPDVVISDSSKKISVLEQISRDLKELIDLKVVYLIKDVRGWAYSMKNVFRKTGRPMNFAMRHVMNWLSGNRPFQVFLEHAAVPYTQVGYEWFCEKYPESFDRIMKFLALRQKSSAEKALHHIAYGNRMKKGLSGPVQVTPDNKWRESTEVRIAAAVFPGIKKISDELANSYVEHP